MNMFKGKVAAITGAASGIGRMLAVNLARRGCHVAISDVDEAGLEETAKMAAPTGVKVTTHRVDVAKKDQVYGYAEDVIRQHGGVGIVINNAGVSVLETLEEVTYEDFEWVMNIDLWGVVYGTKAFLPYLKKQPEANLVNISSVNSVFTYPMNGPYCVAKYAVRGFTQTLCQELKDTRVRISCVYPGGIRTNLPQNAKFYKSQIKGASKEKSAEFFNKYLAHTSADKAANIIIEGIRKNKKSILVGADAYVYEGMRRLCPSLLQWMFSLEPPRFML